MPKILISPIFDPVTPEGPSDQFTAMQSDMDAQSWRGRATMMELPTGGKHGAGGNADDDFDDDPIEHVHEAAKRSFKIAGPASVSGKGSTALGGRK